MADNARKKPRFITGIGLLALPNSSPGGLPAEPVIQLRNVWLELADGAIAQIGPEGEPTPIGVTSGECFDACGRLITPGFVDAHTHPAFVNTRQGEFVRRCRGESYLQIAAAGGGILSSVKGVRSTSEDRLVELISARFRQFIKLGTTSLEAKSGYGLTVDDELKSLRAIKRAAEETGLNVSTTLLGAHTVPPEFKGNPDKYVDLVIGEMIPLAAAERLADAVDVFVEETAFTLNSARRIFEAGKSAGLALRIHADQFTALGGAELAAEFKALSADHMDRTGETQYRMLAEAGVTLCLLPGAVFFLRQDRYADGRRMIDSGCRIAISTDYNPGSSPTQSMPLMMTIACLKMGLTPKEALWGATLGGAYAIGKADEVGTLLPGYRADLALWDAPDIDFLPYAFGDQRPVGVFRSGNLVSWDGDCKV